ncbi:LysR family transcriptional regulator [Inquilinus limosus]|uniref:LysR family transcriptional regulator n=1 Tax=Inquilinus limosus TaxID=171674 RepID=UPI000404788D|nr:LysR family transcriptional regulator [Inquilinus limosus]
MNLDLQDLRAFMAIADMGSFNKAADALHLSQSALSRRLQKLEEMLGVPLLERTTRHVALTAVGREFLPNARRLLDEFESSVLRIRDIGERQSGLVTIACIPTAAFYFLPSVIRRFNSEFPKIRFRIIDHGANEGLESVARGEVEFGISMLGSTHPDIEFQPLADDPFVLACRRDHDLAGHETVTWADLAPYRLITVGRSSGNRMIIDAALGKAGQRLDWFYEVMHLSTSLGLVEAGLGISVLPRLATPAEDHPLLVRRPIVGPEIHRTIGIIRRRGSQLAPAAQKFHQMLLAAWRDGDAPPGRAV